MASAPWPNFKNPRARLVAGEYERRSGGKIFDTNSGYSYDGMLLVADIWSEPGRRASSRPRGTRMGSSAP